MKLYKVQIRAEKDLDLLLNYENLIQWYRDSFLIYNRPVTLIEIKNKSWETKLFSVVDMTFDYVGI